MYGVPLNDKTRHIAASHDHCNHTGYITVTIVTLHTVPTYSVRTFSVQELPASTSSLYRSAHHHTHSIGSSYFDSLVRDHRLKPFRESRVPLSTPALPRTRRHSDLDISSAQAQRRVFQRPPFPFRPASDPNSCFLVSLKIVGLQDTVDIGKNTQ